MELGLSLGDRPTTPFSFLDKTVKIKKKKELGFCMALGRSSDHHHHQKRELVNEEEDDDDDEDDDIDQDLDHDQERLIRSRRSRVCDSDFDDDNNIHVPLQLELLPSVPVPRGHMTASHQFRFPWLTDNYGPGKGFDVNRQPGAAATVAVTAEEVTEEGVTISSPNSTLSSFHMDFCVRTRDNNNIINSSNNINNNNNNIIMSISGNKRSDTELETERANSRASDDEENGSTRKKLRLSKEQSAFLEESFKEHSTLNPKQKLALAKQLNLRPRQVEVWFQNRRARTKLKQTEVDCEYLKRCCETLTEENRRLQKELQELRALKTSQPFYMQLPATTLTMCPSCERVATANSVAPSPVTVAAKLPGKRD